MFEPKKNLFINSSNQLLYIEKQENNPIIMKDYTIFAKEIIDKLKEAEVKLNDKLREENDKFYGNLKFTIFYLSKNYEEDLFSELYWIWRFGNLRSLDKILEFESSYSYIVKAKKEIFEKLIKILIEKDSIYTSCYILTIFIKIISYTNNKDLFTDVIDNFEQN